MCLQRNAWRRHGAVKGQQAGRAGFGQQKRFCTISCLEFPFLVQKFFGFEIFFSKGILTKFKGNRILLLVLLVLSAEFLWLIFDRAYFYFLGRYGRVFDRLKQE